MRTTQLFLGLTWLSCCTCGAWAQGPSVPGSGLADEFDNTMVFIPGGEFRYGMTDEEKRAAAAEAGVHVDMLRCHTTPRHSSSTASGSTSTRSRAASSPDS